MAQYAALLSAHHTYWSKIAVLKRVYIIMTHPTYNINFISKPKRNEFHDLGPDNTNRFSLFKGSSIWLYFTESAYIMSVNLCPVIVKGRRAWRPIKVHLTLKQNYILKAWMSNKWVSYCLKVHSDLSMAFMSIILVSYYIDMIMSFVKVHAVFV